MKQNESEDANSFLQPGSQILRDFRVWEKASALLRDPLQCLLANIKEKNATWQIVLPTDLLTTQSPVLVWYRVLTGMHPNWVTVVKYLAAETRSGSHGSRGSATRQAGLFVINTRECHVLQTNTWLCNFSLWFPLIVPDPVFVFSSPYQLLTRTPCPGPEEAPNTTWPIRVAFLGTASGWKSGLRCCLVHVRFLLFILYITP